MHHIFIGIFTRSQKASSDQSWISIPLPAKLLKVLIGELRSQLENYEAEEEEDEDEEVHDIIT